MSDATVPHDHLPGMGRAGLTPLYDPLTRLLGMGRVHRRLIDRADLRDGHRVLEIGCGTGNVALAAKRAAPGTTIVASDPDVAALDRARRKSARSGLAIDWTAGVAQDLPHADGSFDRVLSSLMLHHLETDERVTALREVRRVLATGGALHLVDFGGRSDDRDGWTARRLASNPRLADNYGDGIARTLRSAGFAEIVELDHRVSRLWGRVTFYRAAG